MNDGEEMFGGGVVTFNHCSVCRWSQSVEDVRCIKCGSNFTYNRYSLGGDYLKTMFLNQVEWVNQNNPTEEEKEEALAFAKAHYELRLL